MQNDVTIIILEKYQCTADVHQQCFQSQVLLPRPRKEKTHCSTAAVCSLRFKGTSSGAKSTMARTTEDRHTKVFEAAGREELVK